MLIFAAEVIAAAWWYRSHSNAELRVWLRSAQFWSLEGLFLAFLVTTTLVMPRLIRSLGIGWRWWATALTLTVGAIVLTLTLPAHTSRILYDEQIYQNVGHSLSDMRLAQMCNSGIVEYGRLDCLEGEYNKEPNGYPYLLSLGYRLFGTSERVAFGLNALTHGLLVLALFMVTTRLSGEPRAGFFAGLAATFTPEQLRWSATAAVEPSAAFWSLVAALAAIEFCRARTTRVLAWAVCASAFAIQFRPESALIVIVVGLILLVEAPEEILTPRMGWAVVIGGALVVVYVGHLIAVSSESWGTVGPTFSTIYLWGNLQVNLWFFLNDGRFLVGIVPAAFVGLVAGATTVATRVVIAVYALAFWAIFLFFYAGSYNYGADVRYSLMTYPPLMILAGLGLSAIASRLAPVIDRRRATLIITLGICWLFLGYAPYVRAIGEEAWGARADVAFARTVSRELPAQSLVFTQDPNMFLLWGRNARQLSMLPADGATVRDLARRHGGHLYLHWGFWCNVADQRQIDLCKAAQGRFPHELVREQYVRDHRFAFYLITPDGMR
jgi:hypothetical protein